MILRLNFVRVQADDGLMTRARFLTQTDRAWSIDGSKNHP
jgi:hypothetical protein